MKNKNRIAFIIGSMRRGGAERVISILANAYAEKGWKVDIITLLDDSNEYELHTDIDIKYIGKNDKSRMKQLPEWITEIRRYVKESKPNRVVSFIARINIITIISCIGLDQRLIISERNDPAADGRSNFIRFITNVLYPLTDKIVFQTKWAKSCFPERIQKKSIIIPNPISINFQASKKKEKMIVAVGRLEEQKNHELLIHAFKKVHDYYSDYNLYIYGEGELRNKLTNLINELGLEKSVHLPGNISNVHEKISKAEIFVLPSNYEGLSNALIEAMMMGLACISTNCAGSNEVIQSGNNGLIVPIKSEKELIKAIELLIVDTTTRVRVSQSAKNTAEEFKIGIVLKQWENIIEE